MRAGGSSRLSQCPPGSVSSIDKPRRDRWIACRRGGEALKSRVLATRMLHFRPSAAAGCRHGRPLCSSRGRRPHYCLGDVRSRRSDSARVPPARWRLRQARSVTRCRIGALPCARTAGLRGTLGWEVVRDWRLGLVARGKLRARTVPGQDPAGEANRRRIWWRGIRSHTGTDGRLSARRGGRSRS